MKILPKGFFALEIPEVLLEAFAWSCPGPFERLLKRSW